MRHVVEKETFYPFQRVPSKYALRNKHNRFGRPNFVTISVPHACCMLLERRFGARSLEAAAAAGVSVVRECDFEHFDRLRRSP